MIKLIHPKTGVVREVAESRQNKLRILKRGGFVNFDTYKAPKPKVVAPDPSLAEVVEGEKADPLEAFGVPTPEVAIHVSPTARKLAEEKGVDLSLLKGSGKDGGVVMKDIQKFLKEAADPPAGPTGEEEAEEEVETEETESLSAEDILTHDDPKPESEEEAIEKAMQEGMIRATEEEEEPE